MSKQYTTTSGIGSRKHGKGGHVVSGQHFTGVKRGKKIRRKGKFKTRKEKERKKRIHRNKYKKT